MITKHLLSGIFYATSALCLCSFSIASTASTETGIFTPAQNDECDPTCQGSYVVNGQTSNALLCLKNDTAAELVDPYASNGQLTLQNFEKMKSIAGTWKKNSDGTFTIKRR